MKETQIHVVKSLIYTIVAVMIAVFMTYKSMAYFYASSSYKSEMADASINLGALNHLNLGEINKAIEVLEQGLANNLAVLDVAPSGIPGRTYANMKDKVREIKQYQVSTKQNKK